MELFALYFNLSFYIELCWFLEKENPKIESDLALDEII